MFDIKDKVAIVTGGASGIGLATVEMILAKGGKPVIERLFYPKYPYEYLRDQSTQDKMLAIEEQQGIFGRLVLSRRRESAKKSGGND